MTGVQLGGQRDLAGCVGAGHRGGLRNPGAGVGEPGVLRGAGLVGGSDQLELQRLEPPDRAVHLGHHPARARPSPAVGARVQPVDHSVQVRDTRATPRRRCRGGGRGVLPWVHSFSNICSSQEVESKCGQRKRTSGQQPQRSSEATASQEGLRKVGRPQRAATTQFENPLCGFETLAALAPQPPGVAVPLGPRPLVSSVRSLRSLLDHRGLRSRRSAVRPLVSSVRSLRSLLDHRGCALLDHLGLSGLAPPQSRSTITGAWSLAPLPARSSLSMKAPVTRFAKDGLPRTKSMRMPRLRS